MARRLLAGRAHALTCAPKGNHREALDRWPPAHPPRFWCQHSCPSQVQCIAVCWNCPHQSSRYLRCPSPNASLVKGPWKMAMDPGEEHRLAGIYGWQSLKIWQPSGLTHPQTRNDGCWCGAMTGDLPRGEVFLREKGPISLPSLFVLSIYIHYIELLWTLRNHPNWLKLWWMMDDWGSHRYLWCQPTPQKIQVGFPNQKLGRFLGPPSARAARVQVPTFL